MKIMRVRQSFRGGLVGGVRGLNEGELVPDTHPIVSARPQFFEPVEEYAKKRWPQHFTERKGLFGRTKLEAVTPQEQVVETTATGGQGPAEPVSDAGAPQRPPTSGKGSGVEAWREYAAAMTDLTSESLESLTRDEIIELLDQEGASDEA